MARSAHAQYFEEVVNPHYVEFVNRWARMSTSQKMRFARKVGASWDEHPNEFVNIMRAKLAVRAVLGIEKYKPEYMTREARVVVRNIMHSTEYEGRKFHG